MSTTLAPSEGLIMKCLWDSGQDLTVAEIVNRLKTIYGKEYAPNTVATFMTILMRKGFVRRYKIIHSYQYAPEMTKEQYLESQIRETKNEWFDGSAYGMLASMVKSGNVSQEEITKLKELLNEYSN